MNIHNFALVGGDTDGLAFKKPNQAPFTKEERNQLLKELNSLMEGLITWEDDGVFPVQLVVKTKNYVLVDEKGKRKIKGSALKASMKEKALQQFVKDVVELLITDKIDEVKNVYFRYAKEILTLTDISNWCSKHTITKAVLTGEGTTQVRIREALKGRPVQEGDKVFQFVRADKVRCMLEDFDGVYCQETLLRKLYDTITIFETVIDIKQFPNFTRKKNKDILNGLS